MPSARTCAPRCGRSSSARCSHTLPDRLTLARQQNMTHADFLELVLADEARPPRGQVRLPAGPGRRAGRGHAAGHLGRQPPPSATTSSSGTSWPRCGSSTRPTAPCCSARSGSARPTWPARSGTSPSAAAAACTWPAPTSCSNGSRPPGWTTPWTTRCAAWPPSSCSSSTTSPSSRSTPPSTTDFYELCVERHQRAATIVTSNRTPDEWLTMMADPLLAQSAVDRLVSTAHELIIEGPSYRQRQKPSINGHPAGVPVDDQKGNPP